MTYGEALERYLKYNLRHVKTVDRIMLWDEKMTLRQNAGKYAGMTPNNAYALARRYKLKYAVPVIVAGERQRFWEEKRG